MAAIYSRRLAGPVQVGSVTSVLYTVPSGIVAILRELAVYRDSGAGATEVRLGINGIGGVSRVYVETLSLNDFRVYERRLVLNAGDTLQGRTGNLGLSAVFTLSGYELTA